MTFVFLFWFFVILFNLKLNLQNISKPFWRVGMADSDNAGNGTEFYIGERAEYPAIWIEDKGPDDSGYQIGLNTGITENGFALTLEGDAITSTGNVWTDSDIRVKKDIGKIGSTMDKVARLNGISFRYTGDKLETQKTKKSGKNTNEKDMITSKSDSSQQTQGDSARHEMIEKRQYRPIPNKRYGVVAQEVKEVFPDLVFEKENGNMAVNYDGFIPVLIEALKEQQGQIDSLRAELAIVKTILAAQGHDVDKEKKRDDNKNPLDQARLYQNSPNPFTENTRIICYLPKRTPNARLAIYNMHGSQVKEYALATAG